MKHSVGYNDNRMATEMESLVAKLKELNLNLEFIKKSLNREDGTRTRFPYPAAS